MKYDKTDENLKTGNKTYISFASSMIAKDLVLDPVPGSGSTIRKIRGPGPHSEQCGSESLHLNCHFYFSTGTKFFNANTNETYSRDIKIRL